MSQSHDNEVWAELCNLADELFPQFGNRLEAFREACRQRPDL